LAAADDAQARRPPQAARPSPPAWTSPGDWQGTGIGEIGPASDPFDRPVVAPAPRSSGDYRAGRSAGRRDRDPGPPWEPAPEPERLIGPLPVTSAGPPLPQPGQGIRVPGDMAAQPGATTDPSPPVSFDLSTPPADFDLSTPSFGLTLPAFDQAPPPADAPPRAFDAAPPPAEAEPPTAEVTPPATQEAAPRAEAWPTRASLGFAAAPVLADYATPPAEPAPEGDPGSAPAAGPSYIWDLAATDVFPAATDAGVPPDDTPGAGES
jgi:hypothetical protein